MYKGLQPPSTDLDDVGDDTELSQYGDVIYFKDAPHAGSDVWWGLSLWTDHLSVDELARRVRRRRANGADRARYTTAGALREAQFCIYHSRDEGHVTVMRKAAAVPWTQEDRDAFNAAFTEPEPAGGTP
ncbi:MULTISPECIES: hypothetical protein [Streptomyces]|uniref:Uncharacterized protein n=1 Tax=Streptomyces arboris TaxID=2600619 RepID=A0A5N5EPA2_9ACTN|nr:MULTISPECIES: hypothetical protein [Streptomyces]KAB2592627.1 hypothetical protein F5983_11175 [Streptomyces arboris]